ncbi:ketopantoate reductase family protein [Cellulomonas cellasea]|uniref:Ketopantoate reductase n=2 Tax=Cellulomonas cellasea TaxID=43670 RepID=A0A0A0BD98_9CELL|nr:2-dehydropantoate 2-reductase N-terminal domain-containing protein [Cellulomonas cellasea]KGM03879.1 ketopantoate reductase [Cellulomonas cellasea DSM 20118]GEA87346.1 ketopantoate reductase [Cellulomonas cellasea]
MKIAMVGRGVIASLYGWALDDAGHDVEHLVRPGRAATYVDPVALDVIDARRTGRSTRVVESWRPRYRETLTPEDGCELVVLSVPHHQVGEATEFLAPRIGDATVLMFSNLWQDPTSAAEPLPAAQVVWGFPQAGGSFDSAGTLQGVLLPAPIFGQLSTPPTTRDATVRDTFRTAGFRIREQDDLRGWLLLHTVVDAALYSQALPLGSLADLVGDTARLRRALLTVRELLPVLEARGVDLGRHRRTTLPFSVPLLSALAMSIVTRHVPVARRALEAHSDPNATEPRVVCRDVLTEARRLDIPTPRLAAAEPWFALA